MRHLPPLLIGALVLGCTPAGTSRPTAGGQVPAEGPPRPLQIVDLKVRTVIDQAGVPQVEVEVEGEPQNSCAKLLPIRQSRVGNVVTLTVETTSSAGPCSLIAYLLRDRVKLDGSFPPGEYVVRANGVERKFKL
jgi:hypothetical protein